MSNMQLTFSTFTEAAIGERLMLLLLLERRLLLLLLLLRVVVVVSSSAGSLLMPPLGSASASTISSGEHVLLPHTKKHRVKMTIQNAQIQLVI